MVFPAHRVARMHTASCARACMNRVCIFWIHSDQIMHCMLVRVLRAPCMYGRLHTKCMRPHTFPVIRTHTPTPTTSTIRGTTQTRPAPSFSLLALPISVATQSCCCTQIVGVASSAPVVGTPRVNRTGRSTSHIVSTEVLYIKIDPI